MKFTWELGHWDIGIFTGYFYLSAQAYMALP